MGRLDQVRLVGMHDDQIRGILTDIISSIHNLESRVQILEFSASAIDSKHAMLSKDMYNTQRDVVRLQHFQREIDNIKARSLVLFDELMKEDK